jgi:hypothetical protein
MYQASQEGRRRVEAVEKTQKPYWFSQTVMPPFGLERGHPGRPPKVAPLPAATTALDRSAVDGDVARDRVRPFGGLHPLKPLIREWLLELKVMGRSPRTIAWYQQKLDWYFRADGVENLEALTAFELKRFLAAQQERGLSDNTIHGFLPGLTHVCQLGPSRGVPGRSHPAPSASAEGSSEGDVDLHGGPDGGDLQRSPRRLAATGGPDPPRCRAISRVTRGPPRI